MPHISDLNCYTGMTRGSFLSLPEYVSTHTVLLCLLINIDTLLVSLLSVCGSSFSAKLKGQGLVTDC